jgi:hypothetical protein
MDANKKTDRREDGLVRMSAEARRSLGLDNDKSVEVWPNSDDDLDRENRSRELVIFKAYSEDLKALKDSSMPAEDMIRVGFVTSRTFNVIIKNAGKSGAVWLADKVEDVLIGADPEFAVVDPANGSVISPASLTGYGRNDARVGWDGVLAEIRPNPKITVEEFIKEISGLLRSDLTKAIMPYNWIAKPVVSDRVNGTYTLGGHLHFGSPKKLAAAGDNVKAISYALMARILDELVAVPLMRIEGMEESRRRRNSYGYFGDYRTDHNRLEYRTISAEWLSHPDIAKAVLGTSKGIVHAIYGMLETAGFNSTNFKLPANTQWFNKSFDGWKNNEVAQNMGTICSSGEVFNMLHDGNVQFNKAYFEGLRRRYEKLSSYSEFGKYMDMFLALIRTPAKNHADRDHNMKNNWLEKRKLYRKV